MANRTFRHRFPLWVSFRNEFDKFPGSHSWPQIGRQLPELKKVKRTGLYSFGPWQAYAANRSQLPFEIAEVKGILRSAGRTSGYQPGNLSARIKCFRLRDAIVYSYWRDMRFVLVVCAFCLVVFSLKSAALSAPDVHLLFQVVKDTFVDRVCS